MQSYLIPIILSKETSFNSSLTQYVFNISPEHCPSAADATEPVFLFWAENQVIGCSHLPGPETVSPEKFTFIIKCLEFSGEFTQVWELKNQELVESDSADCPSAQPFKIKASITTTPSLPGDCTITFITVEGQTENGCFSEQLFGQDARLAMEP